MNHERLIPDATLLPRRRERLNVALAVLAMTTALHALAGPGAHGPNGEHLDDPAPVAVQATTAPRMETHTEAFELVASLGEHALSVWLDHYQTNEPVREAELQLDVGGATAQAKFNPERGDHVISDPAVLKILRTPGSHALVFTLIKGADSDLLEGTLVVRPDSHASDGHGAGETGHAHGRSGAFWVLSGLLAMSVAGGGWWLFGMRRGRVLAASAKEQ